MAEHTYLQRLVSRMGMPAVPPANAPGLALPHAPLPPVFDPFAAPGPLEEAPAASPVVDSPVTGEPILPSAPPPTIQVESTTLPVIERETIREVVSVRSEQIVVEPPGVEANRQAVDAMPPQQMEHADELQPVVSLEPTIVERTLFTTIEPAPPELSSVRTTAEDEDAGDLLPQPQPQIVERIIRESPGQPQAETPATSLEPPPAQNIPNPAPVLEMQSPQITIGEIVVEVVTQSEKPARTPSLPQPRNVRPLPAPAARPGVRSKRSFGLGQI